MMAMHATGTQRTCVAVRELADVEAGQDGRDGGVLVDDGVRKCGNEGEQRNQTRGKCKHDGLPMRSLFCGFNELSICRGRESTAI